MPARLRKDQQGAWKLEDDVPPPLAPLEEARKAASDLRSFYKSLPSADRWATGASVLLLASLALPWRWTKDEEELIGIVSAWPVLVLGGAILFFVYLRARKANAALDRRLRWAQVIAAGCAAGFCGFYLPWATETHALRAVGRSIAITISTPQIGAYLGLVCAVAALFASIPALKGD